MRVNAGQLRLIIEGILEEDIWSRKPTHAEVQSVMRQIARSVITEVGWISGPNGIHPGGQSTFAAVRKSVRLIGFYRAGKDAYDRRRLIGEFTGMIRALPDASGPWVDLIREGLSPQSELDLKGGWDQSDIPTEDLPDVVMTIANEIASMVRHLKMADTSYNDPSRGFKSKDWEEHAVEILEI